MDMRNASPRAFPSFPPFNRSPLFLGGILFSRLLGRCWGSLRISTCASILFAALLLLPRSQLFSLVHRIPRLRCRYVIQSRLPHSRLHVSANPETENPRHIRSWYCTGL